MSTTQTPASDAFRPPDSFPGVASRSGQSGEPPVRQVGKVAVRIDRDVGDQLRAGAADLDLVDELDLPLLAGPEQVSVGRAVLSRTRKGSGA
jgi:hypothetical protein